MELLFALIVATAALGIGVHFTSRLEIITVASTTVRTRAHVIRRPQVPDAQAVSLRTVTYLRTRIRGPPNRKTPPLRQGCFFFYPNVLVCIRT